MVPEYPDGLLQYTFGNTPISAILVDNAAGQGQILHEHKSDSDI